MAQLVKLNDELYHHGRKGQKWGEQNGPPYPLNKSGIQKFKYNLEKDKKQREKDREYAREQKRKTNSAIKRIKEDTKNKERINKAIKKSDVKLKTKELPKGLVNNDLTKNLNIKNALKTKDFSSLTNQEIKELTDRLRLENELKRTISSTPKVVKDKGKSIVGKAFRDIVQPAAIDLGKTLLKNYGLNFAMSKNPMFKGQPKKK